MTPSSESGAGGSPVGTSSADVLAELRTRRETDAPTHGGRILSYVYDSGLAEIDRLAADAAAIVQPVNGLDPTVFGSVASLERDLITFARTAFGAAFASGAVTVDDALGLDSASTEAVLVGAGIDPHTDPAGAAEALDLSAVIAAIDLLPRPITAKMLTEFLAGFTNP